MLGKSVCLVILAKVSATLACLDSSQHPFGDICHGPASVYTVEQSQGKGLGVFALHDLDVGDVVMREDPIINISPPDFVRGTGYPMAAVTKLVKEQFDTLSPAQKSEVLALTSHGTETERQTMDEIGIIFRTNAYNTGDKIGLFPRIARINHSCRPNTSYYWSDRLNKRIVYATRKIKKGEEFFVSYIPLLLSREDRQKQLDRYGFKCSCEACAQDGDTLQASDNRRTTLRKAFVDFEPQLTLEPLKSKSAKLQARKNAKASLQLAELVQEEGLADYYAKAYRIVAISHARVEDWQPAAVWANKGYELKVIEDPQSPFTYEMFHLTSRFIENWEKALSNESEAQI